MARTPTIGTSTARVVASIILVVCVIGTGLAVWGLGAQDRVSSDLFDVRSPALGESGSAVEGHAAWAIEILNGRIVTNTEVAQRFSLQMLTQVETEQFLADTRFLSEQGPWELRGYVIEDDGSLSSSLTGADGEILDLSVLAASDETKIAGLLVLFSDGDRGPFQPIQAVLHVIAAWGLLLAGAATWLMRHRPQPGRLLMVAGFVWLAQMLELSDNGIAYTFGLIAGPVAVATMAMGLLAFDHDSRPGRRLAVTGLIAAALVATLSPLLAIDTSVAALPDQFLSITHDRDLAVVLAAIGHGLTIVASLASAAVLYLRSRSTFGIGAHLRTVLAAAGGLIAAALSALALWGLTGDHHDLSQSFVVSAAVLVVPVGIALATVQESRFALDGLATMVADVGEAPTRSGLQASLAKALGDPTVQLAFWSSDQGEYITSTGHPIEVAASQTRAVTLLGEGQERLGAVLHDPALLAEPTRVQAASSAIGLAIENEQRKAIAASVLRSSRARIAESAEQARRTVERDLHDGAQQRLIALQLSLKLEQQRAERAGDSVDPAFLRSVTAELGDAIDELRELGRGLRPSALDHGLQAAVESLAERSPLPVVTDVSDVRSAPTVEAAAYFVINESVANATRHSGADHIRVTVEAAPDELVVVVADDGAGGASAGSGTGLQSLEDRVLAMDGRFDIASPPGKGTVVTVALPRKDDA